MIRVVTTACVLLAGGGCLTRTSVGALQGHEEVVDGLPPWMTKGEEVRLAVVRELLETDNTIESLTIITDMRSKGFDSPELDYYQGKALRIDGVTSESERLLLKARRRMGRDPRPSEELCLLYADLQQVEDAIDSCRRATQSPDATAAAYNNLGFLLLSAGRAEEALESCEMAVELDGGEPRYRNNLGLAQAGSGQPEQAFRTFKSTMKDADAAYMVGVAVERFDNAEEAKRWYDKALRIEPNHAETRLRVEGITEVGDPWDTPVPDIPTEPKPPEEAGGAP